MSLSFGFLSTFPPTQCGLATFSAALLGQLLSVGHDGGVIRVVPSADDVTLRPAAVDDPVVGHLVHASAGSQRDAVAALDRFDVVVVQHEYGIYGGPDGDAVLGVLHALAVPAIVVLHTVLVDPTTHQREVLEAVVRAAAAVVVMTETARRRLAAHYDVDEAKVRLIPHGAVGAEAPATDSGPAAEDAGRPYLLTWGLLGPGKGIERVIDALPSLRDVAGGPRYLVVGDTHPRVVEREGERYRLALMAQAARLGVADLVTFRPGYLDGATLRAITAAASAVVLPYDSREQVTSGVLIEAVAAGRPVVATAFAHAVELLSGGAGLVVDHDDPAALAGALRRVLSEPDLAGAMHERATRLAPELCWPAVAERYRELAASLLDRPGLVADVTAAA